MSSKAELERTKEVVQFLCEKFPNAFSLSLSGIRPLKHNILEDIVESLGSEEFRTPVKRALSYYKTRIHYQKKIVSGKWYRDINGNRISLIPMEDKDRALLLLSKIQSKIATYK